VIAMGSIEVENNRYVYDPLYGIIYLPRLIWEVISCPELQRLREVRLCNINSLCLTGGANINRYEHSIGTCYLAMECLRNWPPLNPLTDEERKRFLLAALLHDIVNGPFGHSFEYVESKVGYDPEKAFRHVVLGDTEQSYKYRLATLEPIFFGLQKELVMKLDNEDLEAIGKIIAGRGRLGSLINGTMDLDNIDNVFRLAYHIGIVKSGTVPLNLARSLYVEKERIIINEEAVPLIGEWFEVRKKLYSFLLLNPEEFSAKCMLNEAIELARLKGGLTFRWHDTDYDLLTKLSRMALIRLEERGYLFQLDESFEDGLYRGTVSEELRMVFQQNGFTLSSLARVEPSEKGWKIVDIEKGKTRIYPLEKTTERLNAYVSVIRGVEISRIIKNLVKGDLYGCIGIFETTRIECLTIFDDPLIRREMENGISEIVGRLLGGRFRSASIGLHLIKDINKTERLVQIETERGERVSVGQSSRRLLIGAFFRNPQLNLHHLEIRSKSINEIRKHIMKYLAARLDDPAVAEVEIYGEAK